MRKKLYTVTVPKLGLTFHTNAESELAAISEVCQHLEEEGTYEMGMTMNAQESSERDVLRVGTRLGEVQHPESLN